MKFNHFCLLAGVLLIVLSLSVFANAACSTNVTQSTCSFCNTTTSACGSTSTCSPNTTNCPNPVCGSALNSCNNGNFIDVNDSTTQYRWSCKNNLGNSVCCSLDKPCRGVCGSEVNTCDSGDFVDVNDSSTQIKWVCAGVSTNTNCTANVPVDPCSYDLAPYILEIPDYTISYKENLRIDLWDYVKDSDDFPNELDMGSFVSSGNIGNLDFINCNIVSNRYFECNVIGLGEMNFSINVSDSCHKIANSNYFKVSVINEVPKIFIPNQTISYTQSTIDLLDLFNYSSDEDKQSLRYEVIAQSNSYFTSCYILDQNHYLSCSLASANTGTNDITIRATDVFGLTAETTFKLTITNTTPVWNSIPSTCINESKTKFIDLRNYVSDTEDKNNLTFILNQNTIVDGLSCSLVDSNFISCTLESNKKLSVVLDLNAIDSKGNSAKTSVTISSNCFDSNTGVITFQAETYGVCLESCSTYSLPIYLKNETNAKKCFDFDSQSTPYNYLNTSLSQNKICLNPKEETTLTLSVNSCGAEERKYTVNVFDNDSNLSMDFKFEVGTCSNFDGFRLEEFDTTICAGEKKDVSVIVKNTSSSSKKIFLSADNEMVLPHFDKEYITLASGEQKVVQLTVNAIALKNGTTQLVSLSGDADSYHIEKELYFDVVDCSNIIKRTFALSVPSVCFDVKRGQTLESQFSIRRESNVVSNCSLIKKDFFMNISGASAELSYNTVSLKEGEGKTILYSLVVPTNVSAGKNYVTINASDGSEWDSFTQSKEICLNVLPESSSSFFVRTQSKDIIWCGSNVFEVEVVNNGDLDETYSLSSIEVPNGTSVSFSEDRFTVKKGASKIIYVSVSTNPNAIVADNQKIQLKLTGLTQLTSTIYFNIKEKTTFDDIQILSATSEIDMSANSSAPFDLVIRNNSEFALKNIIVSIESLPQGVTFEDINITSLAAGELIKISANLTAEDVNGEFNPLFVVSSGQLVNKKGFSLHIQNSNGVFAGMLTGLFSFNGNLLEFNGLFGLVILAIILIVLVWLIILGVSFITKSEQKEVWME